MKNFAEVPSENVTKIAPRKSKKPARNVVGVIRSPEEWAEINKEARERRQAELSAAPRVQIKRAVKPEVEPVAPTDLPDSDQSELFPKEKSEKDRSI